MHTKLRELEKYSKEISILYVEDDETLNGIITSKLTKLGFKRCDSVLTAEAALSLFDSWNHDLLITDLALPGMSGVELIKNIHIIKPKTHVLVVSATDDAETLRCLVDMNIEKFVIKPFVNDRFIVSLHSVVTSIVNEKISFSNTSSMLAMIKHQWNQPLSNIALLAGTIKLDLELGNLDVEELTTNMTIIEKAAIYLAKTVNDIQSLYKPTGRKELYDISTTLEAASMLFSTQNKSIDVTNNFMPGKYSEIYIYNDAILQILLIIMNNSRDAFISNSIPNPRVILTMQEDDELLNIYLEDNAGGIPADIINNIFEPYFSTKGKNDKGIGLHMAKMVVEEHQKGTIRAKNQDDGAVFRISIPKNLKEL